MSNRLLHLLSLVFGLVGLVICFAAIASTWYADARLHRATRTVFQAVDKSLLGVGQRIALMKERVEALKLTTEDIKLSVIHSRSSLEFERLKWRTGAQAKADRLVMGLEQADQWLELTQSSVQFVQLALSAGSSLGASIPTDSTVRLLDELASLRDQLTQAIEQVDNIGARVSEVDDDDRRLEGMDQIAQIALRVIASLSSMSSQLENIADRLTEINISAHEAKSQLLRWIRITAIGITLLIGLMATGQGSLSYLGWKGLRRR